MKIQIEKYLLEQVPAVPTMFNLYVEKVCGSESKTPGETMLDLLACCITIQHAVELIAAHELLDDDRTVTLREYVEQFNEHLKRFDNLLKNI